MIVTRYTDFVKRNNRILTIVGEHMKEIVAKRLRACRDKFGYTQMQAAIYSDITETAYENYERAKQLPRLDILVRIADMYHVSLDYLAGRTDDPRPI